MFGTAKQRIKSLSSFLFHIFEEKSNGSKTYHHIEDNFSPTPKSYFHNFNFGKVTQKRYQICARNLFSYFFLEKTEITNKSRGKPMTPSKNLPSNLQSNSKKIKVL